MEWLRGFFSPTQRHQLLQCVSTSQSPQQLYRTLLQDDSFTWFLHQPDMYLAAFYLVEETPLNPETKRMALQVLHDLHAIACRHVIQKIEKERLKS
jgi:hypothetical protein